MSFPNGYCRPASQLINGAISPYGSLVDPARAILVTLGTAASPVTSGTEFLFPKQRRRTPYAFQPLYVTSTAGVAMQISDFSPLNIARTDGQLGVTVGFGTGGHTGPCLITKFSGSNQSIASGGNTTLTGWNTSTVKTRTGVITTDGTTFTFSEAGTYHFSIYIAMQGSVTYTLLGALLVSGGENQAVVSLPAPFTDGAYTNLNMPIQIAAAGTVTVQAQQTNGSAAARNVLGGTSGTRIAINRTYSEATGIVTGILWCS